eukprot:GEMP01094228.1.p1 GENE.GEMP01094228.1~~GEMP01094228.1.p1  ORF type:complete len:190 (+),score=32.48 GEMP01094228.1:233-802(+)
MIYWWTVPEQQITRFAKLIWCGSCCFTQCACPVCIPCIYSLVNMVQASLRNRVYILTESKFLSYENDRAPCGCYTRKECAEHNLHTILSVEARDGSGCLATGNEVELTLPGWHLESRGEEGSRVRVQNYIKMKCEDSNAAVRLIRVQKNQASHMNLVAPQQMAMVPDNDDNAKDSITQLKELLAAVGTL